MDRQPDSRPDPHVDDDATLSSLSREERRVYADVSRRQFLGTTAAGTLAALAGGAPRLRAATAPAPGATADAVIVLWMAGGMAQTETFDPKRYTPFAPGVRAARSRRGGRSFGTVRPCFSFC